MLKFFRRIRLSLLEEGQLGKYIAYAIGEILLVVIGILIAVSIGEWRQNISEKKELISYYNGLLFDLKEDVVNLDQLIRAYENSSEHILKEIDRMQLANYSQEDLYGNLSNWIYYINHFTPNNASYTEILSNGRLKLIAKDSLKSQILNVYSNLYPKLAHLQNKNNENIRVVRVEHLVDSWRWLEVFNKDGSRTTIIPLTNPKLELQHEWLSDKYSPKFLEFENSFSLTLGIYAGYLKEFRLAKTEIFKLITLLQKELQED
jgi:hypothetical protein